VPLRVVQRRVAVAEILRDVYLGPFSVVEVIDVGVRYEVGRVGVLEKLSIVMIYCCTIASQPMHNRCAIAMQSLCNRCAIAVRSLCNRCAIAVQMLCNRCAIAVQLLSYRCAITALSPRNRCATAVQSLCDRCAFAVRSLCNRYAMAAQLLLRHRRAIAAQSPSLRNCYVQSPHNRHRCAIAAHSPPNKRAIPAR
jgi:hypothetical protein